MVHVFKWRSCAPFVKTSLVMAPDPVQDFHDSKRRAERGITVAHSGDCLVTSTRTALWGQVAVPEKSAGMGDEAEHRMFDQIFGVDPDGEMSGNRHARQRSLFQDSFDGGRWCAVVALAEVPTLGGRLLHVIPASLCRVAHGDCGWAAIATVLIAPGIFGCE